MGKRAHRRRAKKNTNDPIQGYADIFTGAKVFQDRGIDVEAVVAHKDPNAQEFVIICEGCGATASLPFRPDPNAAAVCPTCIRANGLA